MNIILVSCFFILFKINLTFVDTGVVFYISNCVGFLLLYIGIKKMHHQSKLLKKVSLLTIIMFFHSTLFLLLNSMGLNINSFSISDPYGNTIAWTLVVIAVIGMIITLGILYIITKFVKKSIGKEMKEGAFLDRIWEFIILTFVIAGVSSIWLGVFWPFTMAIHLLCVSCLIIEIFRIVNADTLDVI